MDVTLRVNRERVALLGWGRAILLQLAHPLVAAGVAEHSGFSGGRLSRLGRLHATVGAMLDFTFGDADRAARAAARINAIHDRVHGTLREAAAAFPAGAPYSATDPALLAWVHGTLLESVPLAFERFVGPLSRSEKDRYCLASARTGRLLRIPADLLPLTFEQLEHYMRTVRESGQLEVTPVARSVARALLYPPLGDPTQPGAWFNRLVTIGLLPVDVRQGYGFSWRPRHEAALRALASALRLSLPVVPPVLRYWPAARRAVRCATAPSLP